MLIRRSQLHPVTMAAAAGGKMMAICGASVFCVKTKQLVSNLFWNEIIRNSRTRMRQTSETRRDIVVSEKKSYEDEVGARARVQDDDDCMPSSWSAVLRRRQMFSRCIY